METCNLNSLKHGKDASSSFLPLSSKTTHLFRLIVHFFVSAVAAVILMKVIMVNNKKHNNNEREKHPKTCLGGLRGVRVKRNEGDEGKKA
jgi:hypothetical protein